MYFRWFLPVSSKTPRPSWARPFYGAILSLDNFPRAGIRTTSKCLVAVVTFSDFPEPVDNCSVAQVTETSMEVDCVPGYDGGLSQSFHLTVYKDDRSSSNVVTNITSHDRPHFLLRQLQPSSYYFLDVYSSNIRGRSKKSALLTSSTLQSKQLSLGW